jgi:5'-nucleotidase/UDP-sugar diphosphatase
MGLDAAVVGNHEFDAGAFNFTKQAKESARFPVLVANYEWEDYRSPIANNPSNTSALHPAVHRRRTWAACGSRSSGSANIGSLNSHRRAGQLAAGDSARAERGGARVRRLPCGRGRPHLLTSHAGLTEDQDLVEGYEAFYEWGIAKKS